MRRQCLRTMLAGALMLAGCHKQTAIEPSLQTVTAGSVATIQQDTPERAGRPVVQVRRPH
jgi:hypothetical protein